MMIFSSSWLRSKLQVLLRLGLMVLVMAGIGLGSGNAAYGLALTSPQAVAYLPPGNAITDGRALLRYSLPIDNDEIRDIQANLEGLSEWLRAKRWGPVKKDIAKVERLLSRNREAILDDIPDGKRAAAISYLDDIQAQLLPVRDAIDTRDRETIWLKRSAMLNDVGRIEELMVTEFPYDIPEEYSTLPQLKGRATVEFTTSKGTMQAVIDGFSAPVTGGQLYRSGAAGLLRRYGVYSRRRLLRTANRRPQGPRRRIYRS
jgi:peptidylprolyl isomerase